ncbi:LCP family protein [Roseburia faecis]|uniref:LCP family protein n=1 Tax=Roseburia faecis TaxID=301302 RepID=UPI003F9BC450
MSEKKKTMRAVIEIIIAVLVIIAVYFIIRGMDRHDVRIQQAATENETQRVWKEFQEKTVSIKLHKKTWKFAHPVQTYLFIGTDKSGNEDAEGEEYHGSMADALMLVVVDKEEKTYGILQLNRDTITEVPMLLQDGSANASAQMQLCTAHWYGKDKTASCDNTVETVSKMLGGLPIDGYYALKMDAMPLLNHEVGGVTVTLEDNMTKLDPAMKKGATLTLTDRQAELLMQSRYTMEDDRNTQRMRRQQIFLKAFMKKIEKQNAGDVNATVKLYDRLRPYATTDIKMNDLTALLKNMQGYTDKGIVTIDGKSKIGEKLHDGKKHWEFYMDEDSLETSMKQLYPLVQEKGK